MAGDRARGTLERAAEQSARTMLAAVRQAIAEARRLIAKALSGDGKAFTEVGRGARGGIYARLDVLFRNRLKESLDTALRVLAETMAEAGNATANARAEETGDGVAVRFSPEYLRSYLERITPKNAPSLAAVYTESMGAHAKEALRLAAVATFRDGAAAGLTLREQMRLLQENWALAARDDAPFRFVDRAGRRWENARYVQMLARTTAQRVRTAAYCDTLLRMNRPLVRVTNYAQGRDCGVCAAWEGKLLDISSGRELRRFGIPSLDEARAAGLFHPNCVHNVLYVPIDEYPPAILKALGGRLSSGEPAFGNPVKTNALNETAASAKKRAAQAAQAAKEKAKREAEEEAAAKAKREAMETLRRTRHAREADALGLTEEQYATLRKMVAKAFAKGKTPKEELTFASVPKALTEAIQTIHGIDTSNYSAILMRGNDVRHTFSRHGKRWFDGKRWHGELDKRQIPVRPSDVLGTIRKLKTAKMKKGTPEKGTDLPTIRAIYPNKAKTVISVFVVDIPRNTIRFKTMWVKAPRIGDP